MNVNSSTAPDSVSRTDAPESNAFTPIAEPILGDAGLNLKVVPQPRRAEDSKAWDEAFLRVQSYLHAYQLQSAVQLAHLTAEIIEQARALSATTPTVAPVTLAMQLVQRRMADWFQGTIEGGSWLDERFRARGRLAVLMSDVVTVWPEQFLSAQPAPADVKAAMQISELQPGPEVRLSKMAPAALEFGFGDNDEAPEAGRWAVHPAVGMCVVLVGAMGAAWAATH